MPRHAASLMLTRLAYFASTLLVTLTLVCLSIGPAVAQDLQDVNRLIKQGQHAQALDKLNAYLTGKPKDPLARFLKGVVLTEQGKTNEAIGIFQALTEEYPELPEPYNNLAVLYAAKGQYEKAKVSLEMAIQTHPSYATAHENLGDIYAKMASAAYDKALQLDKSNKSAETKLALVRDMFPTNGKSNGKEGSRPASATKPTAAVTPKEASKPGAATVSQGVSPPTVNTATAAPAAGSNSASSPPGGQHAVRVTDGTAATKPAVTVNESEAVLGATLAWARAWADRDVESYLAHYVPGYHPQGESHEAWKNARRERILAPKRISVEVLNPKVTLLDPNHAKVQFRQDYKSDRLSSLASKTLVFEKHNGEWRISQEQSGK